MFFASFNTCHCLWSVMELTDPRQRSSLLSYATICRMCNFSAFQVLQCPFGDVVYYAMLLHPVSTNALYRVQLPPNEQYVRYLHSGSTFLRQKYSRMSILPGTITFLARPVSFRLHIAQYIQFTIPIFLPLNHLYSAKTTRAEYKFKFIIIKPQYIVPEKEQSKDSDKSYHKIPWSGRLHVSCSLSFNIRLSSNSLTCKQCMIYAHQYITAAR